MRITVADNRQVQVGDVLREAIADAEDIRIAVAFASQDGLAIISDALAGALRQGAHAEFIVGLDEGVTDPRAVRKLHDLACANDGMKLVCWFSSTVGALYHPKLYLMRRAACATSVVGSSNLTAGGLRRNLEANVVLRADVADASMAALFETYARLKFSSNRTIPDEEYIGRYERWYAATRKRKAATAEDSAVRRLRDDLAEHAGRLPGPTPEPRDLVGWLDVVYSVLPEGEFTNRDAYAAEDRLRERFPANRNIRAKVRQQLQVLRDMGFVEHLGPGRWRKV